MFQNDGLHANSLVAIREKVGRLRVGTYQDHRITGPCTCCRFMFFFIRNWHKHDTNKCPFQPNDFAGTSSRPLRLVSFVNACLKEYCEQPHVALDLCDGFVYFHGRGQGLAAEWVDGSALRTQRNWTQPTRCCRNPKPTTWWTDVSGCAGSSAPLVRVCEAHPVAVPVPWSPRCRWGSGSGRLFLWSCWQETRRRGPAELARGKGQVDSRLVGVSLQLCWTSCIVNWQFRMMVHFVQSGLCSLSRVLKTSGIISWSSWVKYATKCLMKLRLRKTIIGVPELLVGVHWVCFCSCFCVCRTRGVPRSTSPAYGCHVSPL